MYNECKDCFLDKKNGTQENKNKFGKPNNNRINNNNNSNTEQARYKHETSFKAWISDSQSSDAIEVARSTELHVDSLLKNCMKFYFVSEKSYHLIHDVCPHIVTEISPKKSVLTAPSNPYQISLYNIMHEMIFNELIKIENAAYIRQFKANLPLVSKMTDKGNMLIFHGDKYIIYAPNSCLQIIEISDEKIEILKKNGSYALQFQPNDSVFSHIAYANRMEAHLKLGHLNNQDMH